MLHGVQAIRTHIDVTDPTFTGLKAAIFPFILNFSRLFKFFSSKIPDISSP